MQALVPGLMLLSVLFPTKMWYAPKQPLTVNVKANEAVTLMLTDFAGKAMEPAASADVAASAEGTTVDVLQVFPVASKPGTYLLYAVPKGKSIDQFVGTPLVIGVREDRRRGAQAGPLATKVEPLRYATLDTDQGQMTAVFYYDVAPNTVASFISLSEGGFYDGLLFHRIVPGFVIQTGDPRGDGTGGPGFTVAAEFNDRPHEEGVLSMARNGDPNEASGVMPRPEYANSAGSQFFVCLDYNSTQQLDHRYTAFGKVVTGMDVATKIGQTPIADTRTGRPVEPPLLKKVTIKPVTAQENPYRGGAAAGPAEGADAAATQPAPATAPAAR